MTYQKIGFHCGPAGNHNGIGDYMRRLDDAGRPFVIKSVDHYGHCYEATQYSNAEHVIVFRLTTHGQNDGFDYDVPDYSVSPRAAARRHWAKTLAALPPEFDKDKVWIEPINEVDKNRADWLGEFAADLASYALRDGYKVLLFAWSAGEPEPEHWHTEGMVRFLQLCDQFPARVGVALHEYSYVVDNIWRGNGTLIGRFQQLFAACDALGLKHPTTVITEWGWTLNDVPRPRQAMDDIRAVAELYAQYPAIKGAEVWYLGGATGDWGDIRDKAQKLIAPVTELSLEDRWTAPDTEPPPELPPVLPPTPAPEGENLLTNPSFEEGWDDTPPVGSLINQTPRGWQLEWVEPGQPSYGATNGKTGEPVTATAVPECLHKLAEQLPPNEQLGGDDALILDGRVVYKIFARGNAFATRLWQTVEGLPPHQTVRLFVPVQVHYQDALNEPDDVEFWVTLNGQRHVEMANTLPHREWIIVEVNGVADEHGRVLVEIHCITKWRNSRDFFIDMAELFAITHGEPPPTIEPPDPIGQPVHPPYPSEVTHVILHPRQTSMAQRGAIEKMMRDGLHDIVPGFAGWAHTTAINTVATAVGAGHTDSRLIVLDGHQIGTGLDMAWMKENHPRLLPHTVFVTHDDNSPSPPSLTPPDLPPSPPTGRGEARLGLHASATSHVSREEVDIFRTAGIMSVKVLSSTNPDGVAALRRACPQANWVIRAFLDFGGRRVSPEQFVEWTLNDVRRTLNQLNGVQDVVVELHNEPNLTAEGLGSSWADGVEFNRWYLRLLGLYRQALPGVRFIFPGLSPGGDVAGVRQAHRPFWDACAASIQASDGVGVHVYWSDGFPLDGGHADGGKDLLRDSVARLVGKAVWVTEASRNDGKAGRGQLATEYIRFWTMCQQYPQVQAVNYFVASAARGTFEHEVWDMTLAQHVGGRPTS